MRPAAALLATVFLAACGGGGGSGPMSVEEARDAPEGQVVAVKGTLVFEYGQAMLCAGLAGKDQGTRCDSPALWVDGRVDPQGWQGSWPVQWKESVVLRGTVGGGHISLAR